MTKPARTRLKAAFALLPLDDQQLILRFYTADTNLQTFPDKLPSHVRKVIFQAAKRKAGPPRTGAAATVEPSTGRIELEQNVTRGTIGGGAKAAAGSAAACEIGVRVTFRDPTSRQPFLQ